MNTSFIAVDPQEYITLGEKIHYLATEGHSFLLDHTKHIESLSAGSFGNDAIGSAEEQNFIAQIPQALNDSELSLRALLAVGNLWKISGANYANANRRSARIPELELTVNTITEPLYSFQHPAESVPLNVPHYASELIPLTGNIYPSGNGAQLSALGDALCSISNTLVAHADHTNFYLQQLAEHRTPENNRGIDVARFVQSSLRNNAEQLSSYAQKIYNFADAIDATTKAMDAHARSAQPLTDANKAKLAEQLTTEFLAHSRKVAPSDDTTVVASAHVDAQRARIVRIAQTFYTPLDDQKIAGFDRTHHTSTDGDPGDPSGIRPDPAQWALLDDSEKIRRVIEHFDKYGGHNFGNFRGDTCFSNDGRNGEQVLPRMVNGKSVSYTEYDIDPHNGQRNAKRLVAGSDGSVWYTSDHYQTFTQIR